MSQQDYAIVENDVIVGPTVLANGQTTINVDFPFELSSYLAVYKREAGASVETLLVEGVGYTVAGAGEATGGTVTLTTAANGTDTYAVVLDIPIERESDFARRFRLAAQPINRELDRLTQICQQLQRDMGKTLRVGATIAAFSALVPVADALVSFNASADAFNLTLSRQEVEDAIARINAFEGLSAEAGSVQSVNTKAGISLVNIGSETYIRTAFYESFVYGGAALYAVDGDGLTEPNCDARFKAQTADGKWVQLVPQGGDILASQAGARGIGSSFDDTAAVQACIDYVLGNNPQSTFSAGVVTANVTRPLRVLLDQKHYYFTDSIRLTWGDKTRQLAELAGVGAARRGNVDTTVAGTVVEFTQTDRPGFIWQDSRTTTLRGMWIEGPLTATYDALDFINGGCLDASAWANAPQTSSNECAAMAIDPRQGAKPANAYPDESMPGWTGSSATYNLGGSSQAAAFDVSVRGFTIGMQVGGITAANSDFPTWRYGQVELVRDVIAISHSQCRVPDFDRLDVNRAHTFLATDTVMVQNGRAGGLVANCTFNTLARIFSMSTSSIFSTTRFQNCYGEVIWRLGDESGGGSSTQPVQFSGCLFSFGHGVDHAGTVKGENWGPPADVLRSTAGVGTEFVFEQCAFSFKSTLSFAAEVDFNNCAAIASDRSAGVSDNFEAFYNNATMGGIVCRRSSSDVYDWSIRHVPYNLSTATRDGSRNFQRSNVKTGRDFCVPDDVRICRRPNTTRMQDALNEFEIFNRDKANAGHITSVTLADRVLTINFNSLSDHFAMRAGILPGDGIVDINTGATFAIYSRIGDTVLARQETGYREVVGVDGTYTDTSGFSTSTGTFRFINSRRFLTSDQLVGRRTKGDNVITDVRSTGSNVTTGATNVISEITVGDYWDWVDQAHGAHANEDGRVTAVDATAATVTININVRNGYPDAVPAAKVTALDTALDALEPGISAGEADAIRDAIVAAIPGTHDTVRLEWFYRQPPANILAPTVI